MMYDPDSVSILGALPWPRQNQKTSKDRERNSSRECGGHHLARGCELLWRNQIIQSNEGASWWQLQ